jgi:hypothetical protein
LEKGTSVRTVLSALAAVALIAGTAVAVDAQSDPSKEQTKIYSYQKRAPGKASPAINANPSPQATATPLQFSTTSPYGSTDWWLERERSATISE